MRGRRSSRTRSGLLLGARGDAALIGAAGDEAYVEAEFDAVDDEVLGPLAELRPDGEDGLVLARRIFADGRTRAYAWGRAAAREDVAAAAEALIAMSGQFEQRRLSRPAYQLGVLDAFAGLGELRRAARTAWRDLGAARKAHEELTRDVAAVEARLAELRALADDTAGLEPGRENELRDERERLRRVDELVQAAAGAADALSPDDGEGATDRIAAAERLVAPLELLAPELAAAGSTLRETELRAARDRPRAARVPGVARGRAGTARAGRGVARRARDAAAPLRRPVVRGAAGARRGGPRRAGRARGRARPGARGRRGAGGGRGGGGAAARRAADGPPRGRAGRSPARSPQELVGVGLGDGEFRVELREREPGATGADDAVFLIRPNTGLPFGPVAETASGGELSRVALAIAAVGGGETMIFDEIDAGIGGTTAHAVAETLQAARRARPGRDDHAPAADRDRRRPSLPGREGARRPDRTRAIEAARRRPAPRRGRAHARRRRVPRVPRAVNTDPRPFGRAAKVKVKNLAPPTTRNTLVASSAAPRAAWSRSMGVPGG